VLQKLSSISATAKNRLRLSHFLSPRFLTLSLEEFELPDQMRCDTHPATQAGKRRFWVDRFRSF
jgi:hypothetical protein